LKFLVAHVAITEDLYQQARPDGLPLMHRNNGNATVRMLKEVVASLNTTLIHKYGNVFQTQGRSAKNLSFLIGDLPFVIESNLFQCRQMANNN